MRTLLVLFLAAGIVSAGDKTEALLGEVLARLDRLEKRLTRIEKSVEAIENDIRFERLLVLARQRDAEARRRLAGMRKKIDGALAVPVKRDETEEEQLKREFREVMANRGTVTSVKANYVSLSVGEKSSLRLGDVMTVTRNGDRIGKLTIIRTAATNAVGRFTGAGTPQVGDRVMLSRRADSDR